MSNNNFAEACFDAAYCGRRCFEDGNLGNCRDYAPVFNHQENSEDPKERIQDAERVCLMRKVKATAGAPPPADYAGAAKQTMASASADEHGDSHGRQLHYTAETPAPWDFTPPPPYSPTGGGRRSDSSSPTSPTLPISTSKHCTNLPHWSDGENFDCSPFDASPEHAKKWCDNALVRSIHGIPAKLACCACGGGLESYLSHKDRYGAATPTLTYASGPRLQVNKGDHSAFKGIDDLVQLGCQSTVKVTVTAKTDAQKAEMDASAKAKYASIASGSGEFHAAMETSSAIESISVDITNIGTNNLPTALTDTRQVKEMIETPLSNGQGCTQQSSKVLRIIVKPWVSNHEVAMNITPEGRAALMPKGMYAADLEDLNLLMMQVTGLKEHASKCSNNVFGCTTKAWTEKAENRQNLYQYANEQLLVLLNDLKHLRESDLIIDSAAILNRQHRVDQIYRTFIRPASVMSTLTFKFNGWLTSKWSSSRKNYKGSYKRDNSETWDLELKVDPNRLQAATGTIVQKQLDNDHSWPNWVTGTFFAKYLDGKLEVWQCWVRHAPFGSDKCEDAIVIYPGESQSRVQNGIDDVNADYSFLVEYGNPFQDEQNPGSGSGGVGGENS
eukprot:g3562.t1